VKAVAVLIWVRVSVTGLPASLPPVLSHAQASGNAVDDILLGGPHCLVGKRLAGTPHFKSALMVGEEVDEITRPRQSSR